MGVKAEVPNMKLFLKDKSNNKFRKDFMSFKIQKEDAEDKPSVLMKKETE